MLKVSTFSARNELGYTAVPLFGPADQEFEKRASVCLLPPVLAYIETLRPKKGSQYVLVNALAASEYFGSNINGDAFTEASLIHCPPGWTGNPLVDKALAKDWSYGFPTFYNAHPFCFPAGSVVTMGDRTRKPIDEIEVGEFVATKAGPREVASVNVRGYDGEGIRLTLRGVSDALTATADHPVLVYRRAQVHCRHKYSKLNALVSGRRLHQDECVECREPVGDPAWVPIEDVDVGDYMVLPPAQHGDEKVPREFAELLGWVASEGYLGKKGIIQFSFAEQNLEDQNSVIRCLEENGLHVSVTPRPQYGLVMLSACSKELSAKLAEYIVGVKAEKRFTSKVLELDEASLCSLLGAYIDGDGHICTSGKNKGQLRIRSSSSGMLDILADVLRSLGVEATVNRDRDVGHPVLSSTNGKTYYDNGSGCVAVSASWLPDLLSKVSTRKHVEVTSGKSRKYARVNGDVLVQVTHREEIHLTEKVYCLSVPGPEHYLVSDVVVHNSHHRNKDPSRAYGEVELAVWNDHMKRVELVVRVDYDKCVEFGGVPVWDKLCQGKFADVSMGAKVPFDTSSITLDWGLYRKAHQKFDPKKHKHPGMAVLEFHKDLKHRTGRGIPGLAVTREEYDEYCKRHMNRILPDGRKVFVYNDYPRFFDISFVFIGADRTAKTMLYIHQDSEVVPSAKVASALGYSEYSSPAVVDHALDKTAGVLPEQSFVRALVKGAEDKRAEIDKHVVPSQLAAKAVPVLTRSETDLPSDLLNAMASKPLEQALSTSSGLCIVIKPREFQRVVLVRMGKKDLADDLDDQGVLFPHVENEDENFELSSDKFLPALGKMMAKLFHQRTATAPAIERRVVIAFNPEIGSVRSTSHSSELLRKIGAVYKSYRNQLMNMAPHVQDFVEKVAGRDHEMAKVASAAPESIFTDLSYLYLRDAYMDELPFGPGTDAVVQLS